MRLSAISRSTCSRFRLDQLLETVEEQELKEQIERRIASVYMLEADYNQLLGTLPTEEGYFPDAIQAYHDLLEKYPDDPQNDEALYQLAKAYDLDGRDKEALEVLNRFILMHWMKPLHCPRITRQEWQEIHKFI